MYGVIGDAHLGVKPYDDSARALEVINALEQGLSLLEDEPVVLMQELFDSTVIPNWVYKALLKLKERHRDQKWVVLGGNHDSTKTYDSVSALDAFSEVHNVYIANSHKVETICIDNLRVLCIPHMRSQIEFIKAVDDILYTSLRWDACMLHAMLDSKLDLGPNDLNIDSDRVIRLSQQCGRVWVGHEHKPKEVVPDKVYQVGSTLELDFGELGPRFVYRVNNGVSKLRLHCGRPMIKLQYDWVGPVQLLQALESLKDEVIYKLEINGVPAEDYSAAVNVCNTASQKPGLKIFDIRKLGHTELKVTAINAQFNLLTEFDLFAQEANLEQAAGMRQLLMESIERTLLEDEEAPAC